FIAGDVSLAQRLADAQATNARERNDNAALADALIWHGIVELTRNSPPEADKAWSDALAIARSAGLHNQELRLLGMRSLLAWNVRERKSEHRTLWDETLAAAEKGDPGTNALVLNLLGMIEASDVR